MKKIIFIIFMILSHVSFGQQNCDEKGITTDPNNPINPQGEPFLNNGDFNWTTPGLWDYYRSDWEQVLNPFDDSGNPNIDYISVPIEIRDNKPEDGWELITYRLGYDYLDSPLAIPSQIPISVLNGTTHPSFILYNKYTGLLRVLVFLNREWFNEDYQTANILLEHEANLQGQLQNALFSFSEPIVNSLDNFKKQFQFESANIVNVDDGLWLIGDFPMAYDPCVCNFQTNLNVKSNLILEAEVNLEGIIENTDLVTVTEDGSTQEVKVFDDFKEFYGKTTGGVTNGLKKYKELDGYVSQLGKLFAKEKSTKKKEESSFDLQKFIANIFKGSQEVEASSSNNGGLGGLLKSVPKIGAIVGFVDFFISGGKSGSTANKENVSPMAFEANVKMSGTISTTANGPNIKFATPGSQLNPSNLTREIPMYNEALGVFNLTKTPIIEYVRYKRFNFLEDIHQYKPRPLEFALNPAAGLEIMEIQATIVISYEPSMFKGNFPTFNPLFEACGYPDYSIPSGASTNDDCPFPRPIATNGIYQRKSNFAQLEAMGFGIETFPETFPDEQTIARLNTGYVPLGCFEDQTFFLTQGDSTSSRYEAPNFYCKIAATFKRTDDPNAQPIDMVFTYEVDFEEVGIPSLFGEQNYFQLDENDAITFYTFIDPDNPNNFWQSNHVPISLNYNVSFDPTFSDLNDPVTGNTIGPGVVTARESITIGNGTIILPGTHVIAPIINIDPTVDIPADVTLESNSSPAYASCSLVPESNFRQTDFTSICNDTSLYNPLIPSFTSNEGTDSFNQDDSSNPNINVFDVKVFPNPFNDNLNIKYKLSTDDLVNLTLQNSLGQVVEERNFTQQAGEQLEVIDGLSLPNGIYYLTIKTTDIIKTIKVSKQNKQ
jgi:hypothetical protein